jgi:hypothetical protein
MLAAGTLTSSNERTQVDEALIPSCLVSGIFGMKAMRANLCLLFGNLDTHVLAQDKACDTFVSLGWVDIGEDLEFSQTDPSSCCATHEESVSFTGI